MNAHIGLNASNHQLTDTERLQFFLQVGLMKSIGFTLLNDSITLFGCNSGLDLPVRTMRYQLLTRLLVMLNVNNRHLRGTRF
ncbi:hypothetical protein D3C73_1523580 [compost metagenome]